MRGRKLEPQQSKNLKSQRYWLLPAHRVGRALGLPVRFVQRVKLHGKLQAELLAPLLSVG